MIAVGFCWLVFLIATFSLLVERRAVLPRPVLRLVLIMVVLVVAQRCTLITLMPFYGTEYEDAYEYVYAGRFFIEQPIMAERGLNPLCVVGSIRECSSVASLSHPVGGGIFYACLLSLLPTVQLARTVAVGLVGCMSLLCIVLAGSLFTRSAMPVVWATAIVSLLPIVVVYSVTGFAEMISILLLSGFLLAVAPLPYRPQNREQVVTFLLLCSSSALLPLVKRELIVVPAFFAFMYVVRRWAPSWLAVEKYTQDSVFRILAVSAGLCFALVVSHGDLLNLALVKTSSLPAFSFCVLIRLVPEFISYTFSTWMFAGYGPLLLFSMVGGALTRSTRFFAFLLGGLLVLAFSFAQSYYFGVLGELPTLHFERYSFQLWPILVIILAHFICHVSDRVSRGWKRLGIGAAIVVALVSGLVAASELQDRFVEEQAVRFQPVVETLHLLPPGSWVVTLEPILFSIVDPDACVVGLPSVPANWDEESFLSFTAREGVYLLLPKKSSVEKERYSAAFRILSETVWRPVASIGVPRGNVELFHLTPRDRKACE